LWCRGCGLFVSASVDGILQSAALRVNLGIVDFESHLLEQRAWPKPQTTYKVHNTNRRTLYINWREQQDMTSFIQHHATCRCWRSNRCSSPGVLHIKMGKRRLISTSLVQKLSICLNIHIFRFL
jgi:hypothetical protein